MERPKILSTSKTDESFAGYKYHLEGELVPALTVELMPGQSVYFEHHILLWKNIEIAISMKPMKGAMKRMMAGIQIFVTQATGPGQVSFSRDGAGHVFGVHLKQGEGLKVREHQFLAATGNIDYSYERVKGVSNMLFGGTGFFIDKFQATAGDGILWLHGYGNLFEKVLGPGEQIDVEPGGWLYNQGMAMETINQTLSTGLLAGTRIFMNRFTGPGRLGIQSMYHHLPTGE